ncbi:unnamed protein product [Triticum turgidum subsp. durum]|uniref:Secreted protein n=1 Tax=Triticum turgidum subsp. durum TaxID=4567 RepID=A0A9R0XZJ0_TRITD|nr:unnamed protein product [Triticum turgidum subsp. durum]
MLGSLYRCKCLACLASCCPTCCSPPSSLHCLLCYLLPCILLSSTAAHIARYSVLSQGRFVYSIKKKMLPSSGIVSFLLSGGVLHVWLSITRSRRRWHSPRVAIRCTRSSPVALSAHALLRKPVTRQSLPSSDHSRLRSWLPVARCWS